MTSSRSDTSWNEPGHCVCGWEAPSGIAPVHEEPERIPNDIVIEITCPVCGAVYALRLSDLN